MTLIIVKDNISLGVTNIQTTIHSDYEHLLSYYKAWVAKHKILKWLFGMHKQFFQIMPKILYALK